MGVVDNDESFVDGFGIDMGRSRLVENNLSSIVSSFAKKELDSSLAELLIVVIDPTT